jgi:uncharacterized protein (TIGR03086 family)
MTDELDLLERILDGTAGLLAGVGDEQWTKPTPCPEYDVRALVSHITGWAQMFAASAAGETFTGDPTTHDPGPDAAADFRTSADAIVAGWRANGLDRQVSMMGGEQPAEMVLIMTLMEYATHGWDLAVATGQPVPFAEDDAAEVLARAERTLPPQYRGEGMPFAQPVEVPDTAAAADRLAAFLGRRPPAAG